MKALSIRQPWAWLIAQGYKDIENRSRRSHFRGTIYIHAGITDDKDEWNTAMEMASFIVPDIYTKIPQDRLHHIRFGGIIGSVDIIDCVETSNSPWFTGPYGYVLANPKLLPFMPCRGKLGMFPVNAQAMASADTQTPQANGQP